MKKLLSSKSKMMTNRTYTRIMTCHFLLRRLAHCCYSFYKDSLYNILVDLHNYMIKKYHKDANQKVLRCQEASLSPCSAHDFRQHEVILLR